MNVATATATVVVDELIRHGVRDAVLAPGSRSAPLAYALYDAERADRLRLHVRIDERSAAFLAVGLSKGSHQPVPVITTSGTAVANLHPAVLEASHARVPLLVLSADRPAELRGTGANQTTDQVKLFGGAVRDYAEIPAAEQVPADTRSWRATVSRLLGAARGGPVHLNLCFREPLVPDDSPAPEGRSEAEPWTQYARPRTPEPVELATGPRTVVVAGDDAGPPARLLAQDAGLPLLAEPTSGARTGDNPITTYRLLLEHPDFGGRVERAVVYGHPTLSRPVSRLLSRTDVEVVVVAPPGAPTPANASLVAEAVRVAPETSSQWLDAWRSADATLRAAIAELLGKQPELTPYDVAAAISAAVPPEGLLVVGSSSPIRDLDLMALPYPVGERRMVMANRGLAGIDGTVSTAVGAALGRRSSRSIAYVGDLTFLHDSNGLLLGRTEPRPDVTIVVANDDGGSIFATLEEGEQRYADAYERLFGTPVSTDLAGLCEAMSIRHVRVDDRAELSTLLDRVPDGIEVVEAPLDRTNRRSLDRDIRGLIDTI